MEGGAGCEDGGEGGGVMCLCVGIEGIYLFKGGGRGSWRCRKTFYCEWNAAYF